ncbi:PREDICTED: putative lipoyltransferase 2, mitochondrial [Priapulus caudatus]|uniref:Octanoyl-[acyl-carrier-protein]:protein N-octanoyltransferase LIPT2, mitochondrial n=1 Tax=Priapulus caudatus TaxID=37621 RepID=A0ABM1DWY9_PRICU|nr:PREDICTED: putative lipoyltransferase 2, mitochondrial [Priapulus caudatus]
MIMSKIVIKLSKLGRMPLMSAWNVQKSIFKKHILAAQSKVVDHPNTIILVEHDPVYTIGIRQKGYTANDEERLKRLGAKFHCTDRGGLITFHGPGQLVAYPVINLKDFRLGLRNYVCNLEKTIINMCAGFGVEAITTCDTGVWVQDKKIAAIGVHGSRFITTHGVAINCNTDLAWFDHIVPCGIDGKGVTSLSKELDIDVGIDDAVGPFLKAFAEVFRCDIEKQ